MRRLVIAAVLLAMCWGSTGAFAQAWVPVELPNRLSTQPGEVLNSSAPYVLGYPTLPAPQFRLYTSNMESAVKGFRFRGDFQKFGTGTSVTNHIAVFASDDPAFYGNEYGLVWWLKNGQLKFYQCGLCNTPSQLWTETAVFTLPTPGQYLSYQVIVNSDGSFTFKAVKPWAPYQTVATVNIPKASWLPNMYGSEVKLALVVKRSVEDGGSWVSTVLHADAVDVRR